MDSEKTCLPLRRDEDDAPDGHLRCASPDGVPLRTMLLSGPSPAPITWPRRRRSSLQTRQRDVQLLRCRHEAGPGAHALLRLVSWGEKHGGHTAGEGLAAVFVSCVRSSRSAPLRA